MAPRQRGFSLKGSVSDEVLQEVRRLQELSQLQEVRRLREVVRQLRLEVQEEQEARRLAEVRSSLFKGSFINDFTFIGKYEVIVKIKSIYYFTSFFRQIHLLP